MELRASGILRTWAEFEIATKPPETISAAFGRMLLNIHGLTPPMIANILAKHPTPSDLADAMDAHASNCAAGAGHANQAQWLLADELVPGKRRRKMSETITEFMSLDTYPTPPEAPASQLQL